MSLRVFIRKPEQKDQRELLFLRRRSKKFHFPWVFLALNERDCESYINRCQDDNFQGLLICRSNDNRIIGVANLSQRLLRLKKTEPALTVGQRLLRLKKTEPALTVGQRLLRLKKTEPALTVGQIFYGGFQNAYLSYYVNVSFAGQGLMSEGVSLAIDYAFCTLNLHRLEANIQPQNQKSINLVKRLGFTKEGFSQRYLKINGQWRDHERWALTVEDWL